MSDSCCIEPVSGSVSPSDLAAVAARVAALEASSPTTPEVAGAALGIGVSVQRNSSNRMIAEDGSYAALKDSFAGFTTTVAAGNGSTVTVAGNNSIAGGLTGIVAGTGYYVSAGVLIPESGIQAFVNGAAAGVCYRFVGTGKSTTEIKQAWGEPQVVAGA